MKRLFLVLIFSVLGLANAHAVRDWDGCYQLYLPGSMFPVACLEGTNEEGIMGAGVRMALFHTNTNSLSACAMSSRLGGSEKILEFIVGAKKEMILKELKVVNGRAEGEATFGNTKLNFIKLEPQYTQKLMQIYYANRECKNLQSGYIIRIER